MEPRGYLGVEAARLGCLCCKSSYEGGRLRRVTCKRGLFTLIPSLSPVNMSATSSLLPSMNRSYDSDSSEESCNIPSSLKTSENSLLPATLPSNAIVNGESQDAGQDGGEY